MEGEGEREGERREGEKGGREERERGERDGGREIWREREGWRKRVNGRIKDSHRYAYFGSV